MCALYTSVSIGAHSNEENTVENIDSYIEIAKIAFMLLAAIAALTPTKSDDSVVERIRNLIDKVPGKKK